MKKQSIFTDQSDEAREARARMADVDSDIEGMAKDDRISALCDKWLREGVSSEKYNRRLLNALGVQK